MKSVRVSLGHNGETAPPILEKIATSPDINREVILGGQTTDGIETLTSFVDGDPDAYDSILDSLDTVLEYDITQTSDGFFLYLRRELEAEGLSLLGALSRETVVIVPPIEIRSDRTIRMTIVGHPSDLTGVIDELADGVSVDVLWASNRVTTAGPAVSGRQVEALQVARELGFYEIPRQNGIEAVADELGCAVSTASELLRRGEANAVEQVLESVQ
ncbi:HTH-10 family transcription regulator (plasmid) [Natrialba magadii ATCC 43099]|uniref:Bacterio-opsin activator HTH domain-containing protein n=1 Tax=Natrialba magadii (strain ATCC 43099 / DSM 3394 / CCM 3739 / CIP 104546 / IAM 13178 / JCM 8861 / NBRC 102185 / NCIMB 2190 / MS3) TaxID=547559 RepID=D3T119_NATMM|nr:helix-turn-helix domain-containing protein [Natrialba magadii]ADD07278.1 HTH-10 family transcription regulator [Natrialba magadii ATCC 43099]ELY34387.1 bacterio-opsin activator HTH domain-containing protein [Natrialba magadii ATCC 43099]